MSSSHHRRSSHSSSSRKAAQKRPSSKSESRKAHTQRVLAEQAAEAAWAKLQQQSEFICDMQFRNTLPDIPCDPKFMRIEFEKDRFTRYQTTSLEKLHMPVIHIGRDLGIPINLIEPDKYNPKKSKGKGISVEDAPLLSDAAIFGGDAAAASALPARRSRVSDLRPQVPWLMKPKYVSNDLHDPIHTHATVEGAERKLKQQRQQRLRAARSAAAAARRKRALRASASASASASAAGGYASDGGGGYASDGGGGYASDGDGSLPPNERVVARIVRGFQLANSGALPVHRSSKRGRKGGAAAAGQAAEITCVEVLPVLPHFTCWGNDYAYISFESDPAYGAAAAAAPAAAAAAAAAAAEAAAETEEGAAAAAEAAAAAAEAAAAAPADCSEEGLSRALLTASPQQAATTFLLPTVTASGGGSGDGGSYTVIRSYDAQSRVAQTGQFLMVRPPPQSSDTGGGDGSGEVRALRYCALATKVDLRRVRGGGGSSKRRRTVPLTLRELTEGEEEGRQAKRRLLEGGSGGGGGSSPLRHSSDEDDGSNDDELGF